MAEAPRSKSPMESKKFVAYLLAETTWKLVVLCGLGVIAWQVTHGQDPSAVVIWLLVGVVIIAGFIEAGYIGGVTWLDRYADVARDIVNAAPGKAPEKPVEVQAAEE
jgi:hypothetical protein